MVCFEDASVVDQHINPGVGCCNLVRHCRHLRQVRKVGQCGRDVGPRLAQGLCRGGEFARATAMNDQVMALLGKCLGRRATNTVCRTGDKNDLLHDEALAGCGQHVACKPEKKCADTRAVQAHIEGTVVYADVTKCRPQMDRLRAAP